MNFKIRPGMSNAEHYKVGVKLLVRLRKVIEELLENGKESAESGDREYGREVDALLKMIRKRERETIATLEAHPGNPDNLLPPARKDTGKRREGRGKP